MLSHLTEFCICKSKKTRYICSAKMNERVPLPLSIGKLLGHIFGLFLCPYINNYGCHIHVTFSSTERHVHSFSQTGYDSRFFCLNAKTNVTMKNFLKGMLRAMNEQPPFQAIDLDEEKASREEVREQYAPSQVKNHADNAKRNAEFWDMVHVNLGHAHVQAVEAIMHGSANPFLCEAYSKTLNFCNLITQEDMLKRAQEKYGTENFFEIFKQLPTIGL